jgi:XTP/dITP diphosphohydrolase
VRSKRWSGRVDLTGHDLDEANNSELLRALQGASDRRARYVCVAALASRDRELVRRGEVGGEILERQRGRGGFGYDPLFFATELGMTFGEASLADKERVSHRGRAFRALLHAMRAG